MPNPQFAFSHIAVGLLVVSRQGIIVESNPAAHDLLGHEGLANTSLFGLLHTDDLSEVKACLAEPGASTCEVRFVTAADAIIWVRLTTAEGPPPRLLTLEDLTAAKQMEWDTLIQARRNKALNQTLQALTSSLRLNDILTIILANVRRLVPHEAAVVILTEGERLRLIGKMQTGRLNGKGLSTSYTRRGDIPFVQELLDGPRVITDDDTLGRIPLRERYGWARAFASVPIHQGETTIGLLNLYSRTPNTFLPPHLEILSEFAGQAAAAITNARLYEREHKRHSQMESLRRAAEGLTATLTTDTLREVIQHSLRDLITYDWLRVITLQPGFTIWGVGEGGDQQSLYPAEERAAESGDTLHLTTGQLPGGVRSVIVLPLRTEGAAGLLSIGTSPPRPHDEDTLAALRIFAEQVATAEGSVQAYKRLNSTISELKRTQQHLRRTQRLAAAGEVAAGIAHQINNPIAAIIGQTFLLKATTDDEDVLKRVAIIDGSAKKAAAVVRRMLNLPDYGKYTFEEVDLVRCLRDMIELARAQVDLTTITFDVKLADDLPPITASGDHLEDVFINLILNAADAVSTRQDGRVGIRCWQEGDSAVITVADNGVGIAPQDLDTIFQPYFTTKENGTGLGLAIAKDVIEVHQGSISVTSSVGEGTTFRVSIPLKGNHD
jgi:signal transduction histidine kinase